MILCLETWRSQGRAGPQLWRMAASEPDPHPVRDLSGRAAPVRNTARPGGMAEIRTSVEATGIKPAATLLSLDPRVRFRRGDGTSLRHVGKLAYLWRAEDAALWPLSPVAEEIWTMLEKPTSARLILQHVAGAFQKADPSQLLTETTKCLARMEEQALLLRVR